jgi:hypothetical protein
MSDWLITFISKNTYLNLNPGGRVDQVVLVGLSIPKGETSTVLDRSLGMSLGAESDDLCQSASQWDSSGGVHAAYSRRPGIGP